MMVKFILYAFVAAFLMRDVTAVDCSKLESCYKSMFSKIQGVSDVNYTMMSSQTYRSIFGNAYSMWEGYSPICSAHNDLKSCLSGIEDCVNPTELAKTDFIKKLYFNYNTNAYDYAYKYVYDYVKYNLLCAELNSTNHDTYMCLREFLYNPSASQNQDQSRIPEYNCSLYSPSIYVGADCFTHSYYLECVSNYANTRCGAQSQCLAKKLYTLDMCDTFGQKNIACSPCNGALVGSTDMLKNVCTDTAADNAGTLPTLSITLLFFVTLVFQLLVKN